MDIVIYGNKILLYQIIPKPCQSYEINRLIMYKFYKDGGEIFHVQSKSMGYVC